MPKRTDIHKVLIIGSGPIIIGQACEFDYSGTQACKALKKLGYEIVLVNSNPATIMTDPETADVTYIEPLNVERLEQIIAKERPDALLPNLGGQSGLNLCAELSAKGILDKYHVQVIGVQVDAIERGEDRIEFKKSMNALGIEMARSEVAYSVEDALAASQLWVRMQLLRHTPTKELIAAEKRVLGEVKASGTLRVMTHRECVLNCPIEELHEAGFIRFLVLEITTMSPSCSEEVICMIQTSTLVYSAYAARKMSFPAPLTRSILNLILHHLDNAARKVSRVCEESLVHFIKQTPVEIGAALHPRKASISL